MGKLGDSMVIMITGDINIGKTTIINKILQAFPDDICGFCTREFFENGKREGFFLSDILNLYSPLKQNIIARMDSDFKPIVFSEIFDDFGVHLTQNCLNSDKRIAIIDEIGVFESKSDKFVQTLDKLLNSDKIVIAVLKKRDHLFLDRYKKMFNPLEITLFNRDKVAKDIINIIDKNL